jgi:hypothetical protein
MTVTFYILLLYSKVEGKVKTNVNIFLKNGPMPFAQLPITGKQL